ncbi:hypothetical protein GCM10010174_64570 [Kutzneria viridogrisea]|uniref:Uncharacterized protein n=2 Tax=Kutzneria TaxID=43356 RepID=W5WQJ5_9PSEU|nr:hypothetical protein [Kutzneria albida]AHI00455.1 hypothetical protein KALB_7097 [Kutzneria albida DSM 43870]MBA8925634.1 hypothetical protein [Kutzneria viridogrisea]
MFRELDDELNRHLAKLARLSTEADPARAARVARAELPGVAKAVSTLLGEHSPDSRGRCATCRPDHWWQPRPTFPCAAYLAVHRALFAGTLG